MDRRAARPAPGQRHEPGVALFEQGACGGLATLEAEPHVAGEGQRDVRVGGAGPTLVVAVRGVLPAHRHAGRSRAPARSPRRSAPLPRRSGWCAAGRARPRSRSACAGRSRERSSWWCHGPTSRTSRTIIQPVARTPAGLQDHRPGKVAASGRDAGVQRGHPERAGALAEDGPEDARRVEARHTHPVHRAAPAPPVPTPRRR